MHYGMICCGGNVPFEVANNIAKQGRVFLVLVDGIFQDERLKTFPHTILPIGKISAALNYLKANFVTKLIIVGNMSMPNLKQIKPDFHGAVLLGKIMTLKSRGDNEILSLIGNFFEKNDIQIISPSEFLNKNNSIETRVKPSKEEILDIRLGAQVLDEISKLDISQSLVVANGRIIALEGAEGTDELIKRCGEYYKNKLFHTKPILVKKPKTTQDLRLDTPTIGLQTIANLRENSFAGLAVASENFLFIEPEKIHEKLDEAGLFLQYLS